MDTERLEWTLPIILCVNERNGTHNSISEDKLYNRYVNYI